MNRPLLDLSASPQVISKSIAYVKLGIILFHLSDRSKHELNGPSTSDIHMAVAFPCKRRHFTSFMKHKMSAFSGEGGARETLQGFQSHTSG